MSEHVYTETVTTTRAVMSFMNLPSSAFKSIMKIAKRVPDAPDLPAMQVLRYYLIYEQETALHFIVEHALQNSDPAQELLDVHEIVLGGVMHLTLWNDETYPNVFAAIHFDEMPPVEEKEIGLNRVRKIGTRMLLSTSGRRIFQCPYFSREDNTLQRRRSAPNG